MPKPSLNEYLIQYESDTKQVIKDLEAKGRAQAKEILKETEAQVKQAEVAMKEKVTVNVEAYRSQSLSSAKLEVQKVRLEREKELMESVYDTVRQRLENLPLSERKQLLSSLIQAAAAFPSATIHPAGNDQSQLELASDQSIGDPVEGMGGLVAESEDGTVSVDLRFDELLKQVWERNTNEVSRILFRS